MLGEDLSLGGQRAALQADFILCSPRTSSGWAGGSPPSGPGAPGHAAPPRTRRPNSANRAGNPSLTENAQ